MTWSIHHRFWTWTVKSWLVCKDPFKNNHGMIPLNFFHLQVTCKDPWFRRNLPVTPSKSHSGLQWLLENLHSNKVTQTTSANTYLHVWKKEQKLHAIQKPSTFDQKGSFGVVDSKSSAWQCSCHCFGNISWVFSRDPICKKKSPWLPWPIPVLHLLGMFAHGIFLAGPDCYEG